MTVETMIPMDPEEPRFMRVAGRLCSGLSIFGAGTLLAVALLTVAQVILRGVFDAGISGLNEVLSLLVGIGIASCIPIGFLDGKHLRVDGMVKLLPARLHGPIFALGDVLLLVFLCILAVMVLTTAQTYLARGQETIILGIAIGPFYVAMAAGFFLAIPIKLARIGLSGKDRALRPFSMVLGVLAVAALSYVATLLGIVDWLKSGSGNATALRAFVAMWVLMLLGVPLSATMGLTGLTGLALMLSWQPAASVVGSETSTFLTSQSLAVLPLFLLMGALASLAGLSSDVYRFAHALLSPLRAGLCHATVVACAGFGALTGSSLATAATFGRIALPEMEERGYNKGLAAGSVAAGGTLGSLVPPSMAMILYALLSEQSIGALFIAAMVPAGIAVMLYMLTIFLVAWRWPDVAPVGIPIDRAELKASARGCFGAVMLFGAVIGGIYTGVFTDGEAASVGAVGAFAFALMRGRVTLDSLRETMRDTTTTISIIYMLIFGALTFSFFLGFSGIPAGFAGMVQGWDLAPFAVILMLVLAYLVLGAVMDSYAMMVITIPIFAPLILGLGFDPIWWGVVTVICVELGMITPPFGLNLFIIKSVAPRLSLPAIWTGVLPFVVADILKLAIVLLVPALVIVF